MIKQDEINYEIWTNQLSKTYGRGKKAVKAVDKVDIIVEPGIHGFLGPNGAGKTSTINMLVGAISITSGNAKIRGKNAGSVKTRRLIGFLPQDPSFYESMTGKQYLMYMAQLNGLKRTQTEIKIKELLELMELSDAKERKVEKYSGGMKQRLGIAASLIHDPEILILDEPTANLDPIGRADLVSKIKILSEKMSVFVSSHILSEIEQMCEKVTVINRGKIILMDTIKNIKEMHSSNSNIFILNTNSNEKMLQLLSSKEYISNIWIDENINQINIVPNDITSFQLELPKILADNNLMIKIFNKKESSLQDIFIEIIGEDDKNDKNKE